ncbi:dirigent protein 21-like [Salvia miltiorrhiza]|uniref:dirigent protein 21-like n=1 Tax=Salvia miltiorrhiza TaxID=226208 RepID=UPI0025ACE812|nr:dirigent protein 21-like [Salvia miltiorrhiza]
MHKNTTKEIKMTIFVVFWTIMIVATATSNPIDQSPKAVGKWAESLRREKLTKLHFFCHHLHGATAVSIAKAPTTDASPTLFGLLDTRDDPVTVGPEKSSERVGYAQGISAAASLQEISSFDPFTILFTNREFNGSTLAVMGSCPLSSPACEAAVIGGSGFFRLARGVLTTKAYYLNFTTGAASVEINAMLLHY